MKKIVLVFAVLLGSLFFVAGTAGASTAHHRSDVIRVVPDSHGSSGTVTGKVTGISPKTGARCSANWSWHWANPVTGYAYTGVEWTSNTCGYNIRDRSHCEGTTYNHYYTYSGTVRGTGVWDNAKCAHWQDAVTGGAKKIEYSTGWGQYRYYWGS